MRVDPSNQMAFRPVTVIIESSDEALIISRALMAFADRFQSEDDAEKVMKMGQKIAEGCGV